VHVLDSGPALEMIGSLGEPTDVTVSELALPRDPNPVEADVRSLES
jgi:hypothetical protein